MTCGAYTQVRRGRSDRDAPSVARLGLKTLLAGERDALVYDATGSLDGTKFTPDPGGGEVRMRYKWTAMPISYVRDDTNRRIEASASGHVAVTDVIALIDRQANEGAWGFAMLYDARQTEMALSVEESEAVLVHVRRLAQIHGPRGPVAIVALSRPLVSFGQILTAHTDKSTVAIQVFWNIADAQQWLHEQLPAPSPAD